MKESDIFLMVGSTQNECFGMTLNRCVPHLLRSVGEFAPSYVDDMFIHSSAIDRKTCIAINRMHLRMLYEFMRKHKLYVNLKKYILGTSVEFGAGSAARRLDYSVKTAEANVTDIAKTYTPSSSLVEDVKTVYTNDTDAKQLIEYQSTPSHKTRRKSHALACSARSAVDDNVVRIVVPYDPDLRLRIKHGYRGVSIAGHSGSIGVTSIHGRTYKRCFLSREDFSFLASSTTDIVDSVGVLDVRVNARRVWSPA
ncbi:reverse transcriptase [Phytophthora palmivora]|uniref:Reverse transcriptase n=1 Tax=Phytophthora palmivora TaxID=4796 RepID=A0A2P4X3B1_9STRA|nr:reverse transcriptase [Phytophthora palmivora]